MWIIWPFRKKNFGLAWTVCADFRRFIDPSIGKFVIQDEAVLPYPKDVVFESLCLLLMIETDRKVLELSNTCAFELAFFQPGVGKIPLHPLGIDRDLAELAAAAGETLRADPKGKETYDRFKAMRDADWERMKAALAQVQGKNRRWARESA